MKKIRALIVDDEPLAQEGVALMLGDEPDIEIVAVCDNGPSALAAIRTHQPDLVFLDVQMPEFSGLEVYERLPVRERPAVIFITAYDQYAVQAFEMCAVDYLLKPFRDGRFKQALDRVREQIGRGDLLEAQRRTRELLAYLQRVERDPIGSSQGPGTRLVFRVGGEHHFVAARDIAWIEAQGSCTKLYAAGQVHLVKESLQSVEKRLDPSVFVRIHRSFIVNTGCIKKIAPITYGDHLVVMKDGAKIRLSRKFRTKFDLLLSSSDA